MRERDPFRVEGTGCWCPEDMTLYALRIAGHTEHCTQARRGWEANFRLSSQMEQQKRIDQEIGRQVREAAEYALSSGPGESTG